MKQDWKKTKLGEVCVIRRGSSPRPIKNYLIKDGGMPWVKIGDATESNGKYIKSTAEQIKMEGVSKSVIVNPGDLILSNSGTAGLPMFMGITACIHDGWQTFRDLKGIDKEYLYYFLLYIRHILLHNAYDSVMKNLTLDMLRDYELLLPSIKEQRNIVGILKIIDDKIETNTQINNNLEEQALALFKSYFIDYDNFNGQTPDTWTKGVLGDFVEIKRGGSPRPIQNYLSNSGLHWLKISDATCITSPFINEIKEYIIEDGLKKTVFLKAGALVLSNSATPGIPKILDIDTCIHDGWLYFPTSKLSNEYLYLFFKHIREKLVALGNGSVFTNLKTDILKNYPTFLPTQEVLSEFDSIVKPLFEIILATTREIKNLTRLRDTLLPKLMSGELDVSELDI